MNSILPLKRKYTFWFNPNKQTKLDRDNYEEQIKEIGTFDTAQDFWGYYLHIVRPEQMPEGTQIFLFQNAVKPLWEDPGNKNGGRFMFRVKKNYGNRIWEELLLSYIGEQCQYNDLICGLVSNTKKGFIQISVWVKEMMPTSEYYKIIQQWINETIALKNPVELEFMSHPREIE